MSWVCILSRGEQLARLIEPGSTHNFSHDRGGLRTFGTLAGHKFIFTAFCKKLLFTESFGGAVAKMKVLTVVTPLR